jgi:dTDP-4-amino-4,6-dideoxygalactose transaminase
MNQWPHFAEDEIQATVDVLRSGKVNYWTGQEGREFEKEFAAYVGCDHAIALANGTVALELALYALDVGPGDEVIVTPRTFLATASAVVMRGATPVFADIDPVSQNMTPESISAVLTDKTKAVICVHLGGWPCEMDRIMDLANAHDLYVIEDCAQAHGALFKGKMVGSWGHINAFSFCQDKIMTTAGEGGMVTTNDKALWERAWAFKDHGKSYDTVYNKEHPFGFRWLHESFGTNWRLSEVQSAVGRKQLAKLPVWLETRRAFAAFYNRVFSNHPLLTLTIPDENSIHSYYKYYAMLNVDALSDGWTRDRIIQTINKQGVPCFSGSCSEIYREKCFSAVDLVPSAPLPEANKLADVSLMLLLHPTLTPAEVEGYADVVLAVLAEASVK